MPAPKPSKKPFLTTSQAASIHTATGLSTVQIRELLKQKRRPTNPLIASAWDEQVEQLGLKQGAK